MTTSRVPPQVAPAVTTSTRRLIDAKEVGVRLGCSWRTVLRLADRGAMPRGFKLGALRKWDADQIERWINDGCRPVQPTGRA
jgi:predicted DNA-binding transcriptional regulator AlpA